VAGFCENGNEPPAPLQLFLQYPEWLSDLWLLKTLSPVALVISLRNRQRQFITRDICLTQMRNTSDIPPQANIGYCNRASI
jgi:hypothetical protein